MLAAEGSLSARGLQVQLPPDGDLHPLFLQLPVSFPCVLCLGLGSSVHQLKRPLQNLTCLPDTTCNLIHYCKPYVACMVAAAAVDSLKESCCLVSSCSWLQMVNSVLFAPCSRHRRAQLAPLGTWIFGNIRSSGRFPTEAWRRMSIYMGPALSTFRTPLKARHLGALPVLQSILGLSTCSDANLKLLHHRSSLLLLPPQLAGGT